MDVFFLVGAIFWVVFKVDLESVLCQVPGCEEEPEHDIRCFARRRQRPDTQRGSHFDREDLVWGVGPWDGEKEAFRLRTCEGRGCHSEKGPRQVDGQGPAVASRSVSRERHNMLQTHNQTPLDLRGLINSFLIIRACQPGCISPSVQDFGTHLYNITPNLGCLMTGMSPDARALVYRRVLHSVSLCTSRRNASLGLALVASKNPRAGLHAPHLIEHSNPLVRWRNTISFCPESHVDHQPQFINRRVFPSKWSDSP